MNTPMNSINIPTNSMKMPANSINYINPSTSINSSMSNIDFPFYTFNLCYFIVKILSKRSNISKTSKTLKRLKTSNTSRISNRSKRSNTLSKNDQGNTV
jgi:hypothetical protein